ncbi:MAG: molybdate ABC transporter permease subunit [Gammaproteobacteria bacterium]|nr:MAG: molybdate ABC transporter permease subunit [Gammaproteobacteria bacterium]RTZ70188.1 MAG: molybdate ABC transporter permease subunit [Aquificaceae bacterium]
MRRFSVLTASAVGFFFTLLLASILFSVNWENFLDQLLSEEVIYSVKLSLVTSLVSTAVVLPLSVFTAYALVRFNFPLKRFLKVVLDLPMFFPELLIGLLLLLSLGRFKGIVFTPYAVVLAQISVSLPFAVKVLYTSFSQVDYRLEMVARSLGYSFAETFLKVTLPIAKVGLLSALVVAFARSFGAFGAVLVFAGGVYMKTETLPVGIFLNISYGNLERATVMGLILMAVSLACLLLFETFAGKNR